MKLTGIVYKISDSSGVVKYIGITRLSLNRRWQTHIIDSKTKSYPLYRAMRKYGIGYFSIAPLEIIYDETTSGLVSRLNELEIQYIKNIRRFRALGVAVITLP